MTSDAVLDIALAVLVGAFVIRMIVRRVRGVPLATRKLTIMPVVLVAVGIEQLAGQFGAMHRIDWLLAALFAVVGIGEGLLRGATTRLYEQDGQPRMRYTWVTVTVWLSLIPARIGMVVLADALGAQVVGGTKMLLILLGLTFAGEAVVLLPRARAMGLSLRPRPVAA